MFEDNQRILDRIISGKAIIEDRGFVYVVHDPDSYFRQLGALTYEKAYQTAQNNGAPSQNEALALLLEKNIWTEDKEKEIVILNDNIKKLKDKLPLLEFNTNEKKRVLWMIDHTKNRLKLLGKQKNALFNNTAEYIANIEKYKLYLFHLSYNVQQDKIWTQWEVFNKTDDSMLNRLISKAYFNDDITEEKIRFLARGDYWRSMWVASCKVGSLLNISLSNCSDYQRALITWSIIYDSVYESPDCPSQEVIENDVLLDQWLEQQQSKRAGGRSSGPNLPDNIQNCSEVGIVVDTLEDAEKVYKLNDAVAKGIVQSRANRLKEHGTLREIQLPDVKQDLQMQINRMSAERTKGV